MPPNPTAVVAVDVCRELIRKEPTDSSSVRVKASGVFLFPADSIDVKNRGCSLLVWEFPDSAGSSTISVIE